MSEVLLGRNNIDLLLEALLRVPELADSDVRDLLVDDLKADLRRPFDAARFADTRLDLSSLANSCLAYSGGLRTFAKVLYRRYPGDATSQVGRLVDDLLGPTLLSPPDREALRAHLAAIAIVQIADAVGEMVDVAELHSLASWRDIPTAIRVMERLPLPDDDVPQLLLFTNRLAHLVGEPKATDLRLWTDTVAGGLGLTVADVAQLRAVGERGARRANAPAPAQRSPSTVGDSQPPRTGLIWGGGIPIRNRNFTGRVEMLDRLGEALRTSSKASVLPQTLHGMGGVGKTQLVVEYVYRHLDAYGLVWWVPSEQTSSVLASLSQLAERLGLSANEDQQQTARSVLDALASSDMSWLLVYDNADDPHALEQYIPATGGKVILTSRNQEWATVGPSIEVDVFQRAESIELLQKRARDERTGDVRISPDEADRLADKLGDLPLALEQAAAWHLATAMPISEYIELLDSHIKELLSEGRPANYPLTVAAFVGLAVQQLRATAPATAQLFELFAYLGGEPVPVSLLRFGKDADISQPLRGVLGTAIPTNRTVRELSRYGLAKVDPSQRIQVHRLVQLVLRNSLPPDLAQQTLRNVQNLLAAANPGDPEDQGEYQRHREIGPHIEPADLVHSEYLSARQVVLDHARFLYLIGDYENSRRLASLAAEAWAEDTWSPRLGGDGEMTLLARMHTANALRTLGDSAPASELARETYDRMRRSPVIGPEHEYTLIIGNQIGHDLRIAGRYREAWEFDAKSVALHREVFGPGESYTLRAQGQLAVDMRLLGRFAEALSVDREIANHWEDAGRDQPRALYAYMNIARSFYGMGAYRAGLEFLDRWYSTLYELLGPGHREVLLAGRTRAMLLRKAGRLEEAAEVIRENQERVRQRFGPNHEMSVAATVSLANVQRELGDLDEAARQTTDALDRYLKTLGAHHPVTLATEVNHALIYRATGDLERARSLDEKCFRELSEVLAPDHPHTLCAGTSLATDHALAGEHEQALDLSTRMRDLSRSIAGGGHEARGGAEHPYLLMRAVNLAHDLRATGEQTAGDALFLESLSALRRALGPGHPELIGIEQGRRTEGDIEPFPT